MGTFGAAVGMVLALATLAIAVWEFPAVRRAFFSDANSILGFLAGTALIGGWIGYSISTALFGG